MSVKTTAKRRRYNRSFYYWEKQDKNGAWVRDEDAKPKRLSRYNFCVAWIKFASEGKQLHHFTRRYSWSRQKAQMYKNATNKWLKKQGLKDENGKDLKLPDLPIGSVLRNGNADLKAFGKLFGLS